MKTEKSISSDPELKVLKDEIKEDITRILFDATGHTPNRYPRSSIRFSILSNVQASIRSSILSNIQATNKLRQGLIVFVHTRSTGMYSKHGLEYNKPNVF